MSIEEFEEALARLGGGLERWPADLRRAADALIEASDEARDLLARQQQLDALLAAPSGVTAPPGLVAAILARARKTPQDPDTE